MKRVLVALLVLMVAMPLAMAASVTPTPDCSFATPVDAENWAKANYDFAYKFDDWDDVDEWTYDNVNDVYIRSYTANGNTITITAYMDEEEEEIKIFDWESTSPLGVVMVKSATCYLIYEYEGITEDTNLYGPDEKGVSHVIFGWDENGGPIQEIPEFPTVALPIAAILGLAFFFQRRKE
ncbi:hypothetical protein Mpsy_2083 [Methanolobus psychrophilus R15]|nr:hypothetical protein Mpsy_2083 [Methanolobus psychrophilus R15]